MSYSVKIICHLAILPERAGFSKMYFIGAILEINKVVWVNIYCLSRRAAQAKALQFFSSCEYLVSQSVNFLLREYIACSFRPDSSCCPNTHPIEFSNTVQHMIRGLPSAGGIRMGGFCRYSLILSKAIWQASFHSAT